MKKKSLENPVNLSKDTIPIKLQAGRPLKMVKIRINTSEKGLKPGITRGTFILSIKTVNSLKEISYQERRPLKEVMEEALQFYLKNHGNQ